MSNELTKKAAEMLLNGATLLSQPCPYCNGVRVMKDGNALCVNCGKTPEKKHVAEVEEKPKNDSSALVKLEEKLEKLTEELTDESDHKKQESLLKSINSLVEIIKKMEK